MKYEEIEKDLFTIDYSKKYYLVHCISVDCKLGRGIAVEFDMYFNLRKKLQALAEDKRVLGNVIKINRVFNLMTKFVCSDKPTFRIFALCMYRLKIMCEERDIKYLAMPKLGAGLDKLKWEKVRSCIKETFEHTDIDILICINPS